MRTQKWALQGKEVAAALRGAVVTIRLADNYADAETLTVNGQSDVTAKFNDGYVIAAQAKGRRLAGKEGMTVEKLQAELDGYLYAVQAEGTGPRQTKPETQARNAAADAMVPVFERAIAEPEWGARGLKLGFIDQVKFDAYKAAKVAIEAAKLAAAVDAKQAQA